MGVLIILHKIYI